MIDYRSTNVGHEPEILTDARCIYRLVVLIERSRHADTSLPPLLDPSDRILGDAVPHLLHGRCEHTWT